jgi:hypothetical protein
VEKVVDGIYYDRTNWVCEPLRIRAFTNSYSGVKALSLYKKNDDGSWSKVTAADGVTSAYTEAGVGETYDATHFTNTEVAEGLFRTDFCIKENGTYKVAFIDSAGRAIPESDEFTITNIDYGKPTMESVGLYHVTTSGTKGDAVVGTGAEQDHANEMIISVTNAKDLYTAPKNGTATYSGLYAYYYSKDSSDPPTKNSDKWIVLDKQNQTNCTWKTDSDGNTVYSFDIKLVGKAANGTYHIWVRDEAGNVTEYSQTIEVSGLMEKMANIQWDKSEANLTVPTVGYVTATYSGEPMSVSITSSNIKVVTVATDSAQASKSVFKLIPVDAGTATVTIVLTDYDGTQTTHTVDVTVHNLKPSVYTAIDNMQVKPEVQVDITPVFSGTNLTYYWYYQTEQGGASTLIDTKTDTRFQIINEMVGEDQTMWKSTLRIVKSDPEMDGWYFWCEAKATENTSEYQTTTTHIKLTVVGSLTTPTITANGGSLTSGDWCSVGYAFEISGSAIPSGAGSVGYEYKYDDDTIWTPCSTTLAYTVGDTTGKTLYVRAYNTLDDDVVSEAASFIIRLDTVDPEGSATAGIPTSWTSDDQTITLTFTDDASDFSEDTISVSVTSSKSLDKAYKPSDITFVSADSETHTAKYTVSIKASDTYTVTFKDVAGNEGQFEFTVSKIDKTGPQVIITESVSGTSVLGTVTAIDDASAGGSLLFSDNGGESYTIGMATGAYSGQSQFFWTSGTKYEVWVKDEAGNITKKTYTAGSGGATSGSTTTGGGTSSGGSSYVTPTLFEIDELEVDGYTFGKSGYLDASGEYHDYTTYTVGGDTITGLKVTVEAEPSSDGYLYGYAQFGNSNSSGSRFKIYWKDDATVSNEGGEGYFIIDASKITSSSKNASLKVLVAEYSDEELKKKLWSDSVSASVVLDTVAPTVSIGYNSTKNEVTINATDSISGIKEVKYALDMGVGGTLELDQTYTGKFTAPDGCIRVIVKATDKAGNSTIVYGDYFDDMDGSSSGGVGGIDSTLGGYADAYYYRSSLFNHYLVNSTGD